MNKSNNKLLKGLFYIFLAVLIGLIAEHHGIKHPTVQLKPPAKEQS